MIDGLIAFGSRSRAVDRVMDMSHNPVVSPPIGFDKQLNEPYAQEVTTGWWLERMATVPSPLEEKLTLFWHGHFTSEQRKVMDMGLMFRQNHQVLRANALGGFANLARAAATDPAMLLYLDNWANTKAEPQENFGRELLELFTLGSGSYTEADVVAMARAWTGHGLTADHRAYEYHAAQHDNGDKTLFGITKSWNGPATINEVLFGARAGESSRFIAAKLFSFLAYPVTPKEPIVVSLADRFRASNLNIWVLVRDIFLSGEFWSDRARHALVRSPVEWFVAAMQATGTDSLNNPKLWMEPLGQVLFDPPNVAGWRGGRSWISTSGASVRLNVANRIAQRMEQRSLLGGPPEDGTPQQLVDATLRRFGIVDPSPATRSSLIAWVDETRRRRGGKVLPDLTVLLLCSPDFQLA
jgi:uncharacterized protein (DUF1800 family)